MMSNSILSSHLTGHGIPLSPGFHTFFFNPMCHFSTRKHGFGSSFSGNQSLRYPSTNRIAQNNSKTKRNMVLHCNLPSEVPPPLGALPGSWQAWLVGMVVTVAIPLLTNKWGTLLKWTQAIKADVQKVENIVEGVENLAEKVEKIAEDIADDLPEGKLKDAVYGIENLAENVAKDANRVDNAIDKLQEAGEKMDALIEARNEAAKQEKGDQKQLQEAGEKVDALTEARNEAAKQEKGDQKQV